MYAKTAFTAAIALLGAFASVAPALAGEAEPDHPMAYTSTVSRAQVRAEAVEANRLGLSSRGDHYVLPTAEQLESIRMAGLRATRMTVASR